MRPITARIAFTFIEVSALRGGGWQGFEVRSDTALAGDDAATPYGRTHHGTRVKILIHDQHIRIIAIDTGQLLRDLILDTTRDYQPQRKNTPT